MQAVPSERRAKSKTLHQKRVERYHIIHELHVQKAELTLIAHNELIQEFISMLRERKGEHLDAWLEKAEQQGISELGL